MKDKATMTIKIRISPNEFKILHAKAQRFEKGNISKLIKEAIKDYKIKREPRKAPCE
jgi:spore coat polysaccharide biosynthesis protein SpsF (cytidylyltransferase family)